MIVLKHSGIRSKVLNKTLIVFTIFFVTIMIVVTLLLAQNISNTLAFKTQNMSLSSINDLENFKSSDTSNFEYTINDALSQYNKLFSSNDIYSKVALFDQTKEVASGTNILLLRREINSSENILNFLNLDKCANIEEIRTMSSSLQIGNKILVDGIVVKNEVIAFRITSDDGKRNFISTPTSFGNAQVVSMQFKYLNGYFQTDINPNNFNMISNQRYEECQKIINTEVDAKLNGDVIDNVIKANIFEGSYKNIFLINIEGKEYSLFVVCKFYPLELALKQLAPLYLFGFIIAAVLIIILSSKLSKIVTKPILLLNEAAKKVANGDKNVLYDLSSNSFDEISQLAASLSSMSVQLNHAMMRLEQDIKNKTDMEIVRRELISTIAHEMKTPLCIIQSYSEGLKEKIAENKRDHYLDVIIDETNQINNMVIEMLDLAKLESNTNELVFENFSLKDLVEKILYRHSKVITEKKLEIISNFTNDSQIYADYLRIEQVLSNFIANALNHTTNQGKITITTNREENSLLFSIENEGEKIPPQHIAKIWDAFYKIDKSRVRSKGGTGLGLAIAKNILILHKAEYGVVNTDTGVLFWFKICAL